jgi:hypothetical protein
MEGTADRVSRTTVCGCGIVAQRKGMTVGYIFSHFDLSPLFI